MGTCNILCSCCSVDVTCCSSLKLGAVKYFSGINYVIRKVGKREAFHFPDINLKDNLVNGYLTMQSVQKGRHHISVDQEKWL